jgi:hypothetical protein
VLLLTSRGPLGLLGYFRARYRRRHISGLLGGLPPLHLPKMVEMLIWAKLNKYRLGKLGQVAVSL